MVPFHSCAFLILRENVVVLFSGILLLINRMPLRKNYLYLIDCSIKHFFKRNILSLGLIEDENSFVWVSINDISRKHCFYKHNLLLILIWWENNKVKQTIAYTKVYTEVDNVTIHLVATHNIWAVVFHVSSSTSR